MAFWGNFLREDYEKKEREKTPNLESKTFLSINVEEKNECFLSIGKSEKRYNQIDTPITEITKDNNTICTACNKRHKITQDKSMNKDTIIDWFKSYLIKNKQNFTLDWLRGQKLTFESVNEMRKL